MFKIIINKGNIQYTYIDCNEITERTNVQNKLMIEKNSFITFTNNQTNLQIKEEDKFYIDIVKESLSVLKNIFEGLEKEDDLFNYLTFVSSDIEYNLNQDPTFTFENNKTFLELKEEIINSIFNNLILFYEDFSNSK